MTLPRLAFVVLAICSITVVSSRKLDHGKSENSLCNVNPNEFCSNFTTATECDAVKHCIQNDWSKRSPTSDDGSCTICVQQIQNIRDGLSSNTSKEVIQDALDYVCELTFITRLVYRQCIKLIDIYVDSHINELLDLLRSDVNPETICHLIDLCSSPHAITEFDDVAVYSDNIVLHIPATNDLQIFRPVVRTPEPTLLGAKKCTWGPSYWCGNLTTSKECNSVGHCIRTWSQQQFEEDNDSVCQVCKDMVKQARDQLMSNETQEELKEVLEGSCKLIPLKEVRNECIKLADEFVPELTEVLASQMNPIAVCTVAGLCNSRRIDNLLAVQKDVSTTPDLSTMSSCVNCTVAFTSFGRYMQSATKEDVLARMLAVCSELSSYSDLCSSLIVSNFDDMYDLMNNALPPSAACHLSGMCAYRYHAHIGIEEAAFSRRVDTMLAVRDDDLPCDLCKQLVHHFQEILVANTTEAEFQQMLLGMCQQTGKFESECTKLVTDNFEVIYKFLTEELDPSQVCIDIQICPHQNFVSDSNLSLISGRVIPILSYNTKLTNLMPVMPKDVTNSLSDDTDVDNVECKLCHAIMKVVQKELDNPEYDGDVKKVLEKVCDLVPSANARRCNDFVDEYADTLIKILAEETNPFVVCRMLKICPTQLAVVNGSALCELCKDMMHYIQESLQDPTDEKEIEEAVEKVCTIVPKSIANKCQEFIAQYSALIVDILSQEMDPSLVCPAMKLCPSSSPPEERCAHCRLFMADLTKQLKNNYDLPHIKEKVRSLTPLKGLKNSVTAVELRTSHYEELVDMMTAEFEADESCFYMKFCDAQTISSPLPTNVIDEDVETNEITDSASIKPNCKICELFVHIYEKELTSNKTEEELENMFDHFCGKMKNAELKKNCTLVVKKYVPVFLELLQKNVSPKELCAAAKFCSLNSLMIDVAPECRTCEIAVGSLESVLGDPMMKENVFEEAVKICNTMEGKSRTVCTNVMTEIVPQVESVVFDIPPWFVCTKLKMCPYGIAIDTSVCSNPELWCQDKDTAFMCDKLNYCSKNAWLSFLP